MIRVATALTVAALALFAVAPAKAQAVKIGTLTCNVAPGVGLIIVSQKPVSCLFSPTSRRYPETYVGTISKLGVDIGATSGSQFVWAVYAPTSAPEWALAGVYGGATAEATFGAGVGANALVGGSNRTVMLQPLSFQGQTGFNVAGGAAALDLYPAPEQPRRRRR